MDKIPLETWRYIFSFACTDGGTTGCALSLVSQYIRKASQSERFNTVALLGPSQIVRFAEAYLSITGDERSVSGTVQETKSWEIRHLFIGYSYRELQESDVSTSATAAEVRDPFSIPSVERQQMTQETYSAMMQTYLASASSSEERIEHAQASIVSTIVSILRSLTTTRSLLSLELRLSGFIALVPTSALFGLRNLKELVLFADITLPFGSTNLREGGDGLEHLTHLYLGHAFSETYFHIGRVCPRLALLRVSQSKQLMDQLDHILGKEGTAGTGSEMQRADSILALERILIDRNVNTQLPIWEALNALGRGPVPMKKDGRVEFVKAEPRRHGDAVELAMRDWLGREEGNSSPWWNV